jgi:hypothetical protein
VWGAAASQWISAVYGWWQLREAQREAGHIPAGRGFRLIRPDRRHRGSPVLATAPSPAAPAPRRRPPPGDSRDRAVPREPRRDQGGGNRHSRFGG